MMISACRDGIASVALEKRVESSVPRPDQRPASTQNEAMGTIPDLGGSRKLTVRTRSWRPPLTMSPAWMKTSSAPLFSILSSLT